MALPLITRIFQNIPDKYKQEVTKFDVHNFSKKKCLKKPRGNGVTLGYFRLNRTVIYFDENKPQLQ